MIDLGQEICILKTNDCSLSICIKWQPKKIAIGCMYDQSDLLELKRDGSESLSAFGTSDS